MRPKFGVPKTRLGVEVDAVQQVEGLPAELQTALLAEVPHLHDRDIGVRQTGREHGVATGAAECERVRQGEGDGVELCVVKSIRTSEPVS